MKWIFYSILALTISALVISLVILITILGPGVIIVYLFYKRNKKKRKFNKVNKGESILDKKFSFVNTWKDTEE